MSTTRFLTAGALTSLLERLHGEGRRVLAPARQGGSVIFAPWTPGTALNLERAAVAPKEAALPQCETLATYARTKDPENPAHVTLSLDDAPAAVPTVVVGGRPCDARGFAVLDRPYLRGPFVDPYYKARRERLLVVTLTCTENDGVCGTCFCHWTGGGPADAEGSDILMTAARHSGEDGFVLEARTSAGQALLEELAAAPPPDASLSEAVRAEREKARAALESASPAPDLAAAGERMAPRFTDAEFWRRQTAHCLSCGACTYFCPTCYCFNITDEGEGSHEKPGRRLRTWDTCMASHFTREAGGHNPRAVKALRMRNRVMHKFSYYPAAWDGAFSCSGCGRCIVRCPVHLDIRAIVLAAVAAQGGKGA